MTPKLNVGNTGVACALLGLDADALLKDRAVLGQLLETFVFQELRRQASWRDDDVRFHHFRDKDGCEVVIVLERGAGQIAGDRGEGLGDGDDGGLPQAAPAPGRRGEGVNGRGRTLRRRDQRRLWR